jgi:hypothetical protein
MTSECIWLENTEIKGLKGCRARCNVRLIYTPSSHRFACPSANKGASVMMRHCPGNRGLIGTPERVARRVSGGSPEQFPCEHRTE